jgi:hypothetical protein
MAVGGWWLVGLTYYGGGARAARLSKLELNAALEDMRFQVAPWSITSKKSRTAGWGVQKIERPE